jgi:CRP-like cAMP-binding protein
VALLIQPAGTSPGFLNPEQKVSLLENNVIARLPRKSRLRLMELCKPVDLTMAEVLCKGGQTIRYVYFPVSAYISAITLLDGAPVLEVGMVGHEGMFGAQVVLGATTEPLHGLVQGAGIALRIRRSNFERALLRDSALRESVSRYLLVTTTQLARSAACLRFHQIGPRLARWLLMTNDRASSDNFLVTHEFLAFMLGVRRVGITTAAVELQRRGLIQYRRGNITVLKRRALEKAACSCYAADCKDYATLLH